MARMASRLGSLATRGAGSWAGSGGREVVERPSPACRPWPSTPEFGSRSGADILRPSLASRAWPPAPTGSGGGGNPSPAITGTQALASPREICRASFKPSAIFSYALVGRRSSPREEAPPFRAAEVSGGSRELAAPGTLYVAPASRFLAHGNQERLHPAREEIHVRHFTSEPARRIRERAVALEERLPPNLVACGKENHGSGGWTSPYPTGAFESVTYLSHVPDSAAVVRLMSTFCDPSARKKKHARAPFRCPTSP